MRVLVQWTRATPDGWEEADPESWRFSPSKPEPRGGEFVDEAPGWVYELSVNGMLFGGFDHYAVEERADGAAVVTVWNDDPVDYPVGLRLAQVWTLRTLAPDPLFGGAINVRHSRVVYHEAQALRHSAPVEKTTFRPWREFVPPDAAVTRHGIWVTDVLSAIHDAVRAPVSWRECVEGVSSEYLRDGIVAPQRSLGLYLKPDGTLTFFQRDTNLATNAHVATNENELNPVAGTGQSETRSVASSSDELAFCFTTVSGEPNNAAWPSGDYRAQLDASSASTMIDFGMRAAGGSTGHFARVTESGGNPNADAESWAMGETLFSGNGLHLGTTGSVTPTTGALTDRFEVLVAAINNDTMMARSFTLNYDSDGFVDGPWPAPLTEGEIAAAAASGAHASAQPTQLVSVISSGPSQGREEE